MVLQNAAMFSSLSSLWVLCLTQWCYFPAGTPVCLTCSSPASACVVIWRFWPFLVSFGASLNVGFLGHNSISSDCQFFVSQHKFWSCCIAVPSNPSLTFFIAHTPPLTRALVWEGPPTDAALVTDRHFKWSPRQFKSNLCVCGMNRVSLFKIQSDL